MDISTLRQLFVASSIQLAAFSSGGVMGLPAVMIQQFKRDDSIIQVDLDTASWMASIHGLAGSLSVFFPYLMQWQGRRVTFRINCTSMIFGWIIIYFAKDAVTVIVGEMFQGLGYKCLSAISFMTLSEMVEPKIRNQLSVSYGVFQTLSILFVHAIGKYVSWKTISLIMCGPVVLSLLFSFIWPESPAWLAYKGRFDESEKSFIWLRGQNVNSLTEMNIFFNVHKKNLVSKVSVRNARSFKIVIRDIWMQIRRRDFYLPNLHVFVLLSCYYWSGNLVLVMYAENLVEKFTQNSASAYNGTVVIDLALLLSNITSTILLNYFKNKPILMTAGVGSILSLLGLSSITYLQHTSVISNDSLICLYFLVSFMIFSTLGFYIIPFVIAAEIMPIKHRGIGGSFNILLVCLLSCVTLKVAPYLILTIGLYGTFLLYALILSFCLFIIWRYVPETKNKTLQQIETYYTKDFVDQIELDTDVHEKLNIRKEIE